MKTLVLTLSVAFAGLFLGSCQLEEVAPQTPPAPIVLEVERGFIESLRKTFAGQDIFFQERSQVVAGPGGIVEYTVFQPEDFDGTDLVEVSFAVTGDATARFNSLTYGLKVNLNNKAVSQIVNVQLDGRPITSTNLLIMLSDL